MDSAPQISVITRTKERPHLLARCIESVLAQDFESWSHVIVNDGGDVAEVEEVTRRYLPRYGGRLILRHHPKTRGMEAAANTGIRSSESTFLAYLDDDDTWHPQFLSRMLEALKLHGDVRTKGVACHTEIVREKLEDGKFVELGRHPHDSSLRAVSLPDLLVSNRFTNNAFLFSRDVIEEIGYLNEELPVLGDWDFNIRFVLRYEIAVLPELLARWHWREQSASASERNSIYSNLHQVWRERLINEALRGNWLEGKTHLALMLALGDRAQRLERELHELSRRTEELARKHDQQSLLLSTMPQQHSSANDQVVHILSERFDEVAQKLSERFDEAAQKLSRRFDELAAQSLEQKLELTGIVRDFSFLVQLKRVITTRLKRFFTLFTRTSRRDADH